MKKSDVFHTLRILALFLVLAAAVLGIVLFFEIRREDGGRGPESGAESVPARDTVFLHDTIYMESPSLNQSPEERFREELKQVFAEEFSPLYGVYDRVTEENVAAVKAVFDRCRAAEQERIEPLCRAFLEKYPETADEVPVWVSKETALALRPYFRLLNEYGNRE